MIQNLENILGPNLSAWVFFGGRLKEFWQEEGVLAFGFGQGFLVRMGQLSAGMRILARPWHFGRKLAFRCNALVVW